MAIETASGLERAQACPDSFFLPQVQGTNEDAERGTALHRFQASVLDGTPRAEALKGVPAKWRKDAEALDPLAAVAGCSDVRTEVSYAINVKTGGVRELGRHLGRRYVVTDDEIAGTLDVEGVTFDDVPFALDWKNGWAPVTAVMANLQLAFACYARATILNADEVEAVVWQRRADRCRLTRIDLDGFLDTLADIHAGIVAARERAQRKQLAVLRPGEHCRYCPALAACGAHTAIARSLLPDLESIGQQIAIMTPEQAGVAWTKLCSIKRLVDHAEDGLKAMARQAPFPVSPGKVLREITFERTTVSAGRAIELLRAKGATEAEIAACTQTATVSQFREGRP